MYFTRSFEITEGSKAICLETLSNEFNLIEEDLENPLRVIDIEKDWSTQVFGDISTHTLVAIVTFECEDFYCIEDVEEFFEEYEENACTYTVSGSCELDKETEEDDYYEDIYDIY